MADKRINALTTTSASVGDDYFAIDGATNGTRALSAFSPTFGGNATVTGTLTVNGVGESTFGGITRVNNGALVASGSSAPSSGTGVELQHDGTTGRILSYNRTGAAGQLLTINHAGGNIELGSTATQVSVKGTTASTSTSSGALVVSGGVGVAGNVNCGGVLSTGAGINAGVGVYIQNAALTGADQFGLASEPTWTSSAQFGHAGWFRTKTAAASYTLTAGRAIYVEQPTLGAGSSITTAVGVQVRNQGATGVTNAYGLYVESQSGASSVNYAIYTAGGRINFQGLPTSSAGLPAGTLWNDGGTLKVA